MKDEVTVVNRTWREFEGIPIHDKEDCSGQCPFDSPSPHSMAGMPRHIRTDKLGLVERICPHGVGHPDPDSVRFLNDAIDVRRGLNFHKKYALEVHGCDGCCRG